ncbi:LytTR family transcriptional regulator DNA-binding domain-containing protein [Qipengyuania sp. SS22]|uniref:LytTR family DNA-binding domain-containing protein n=1 Tax=Qipengyuania sp. SS22 TaxID=2979461 RepID=UPI0021E5F9C9|nr:LytTR family DNA-binding domain-containing protein [Qipengyuania sp. SS22]UYH54321.1 LytTR family transcriptional regulator DNA-binding domain-containing protein [Qipengyuania sp. SS22]
MDQPQPASARIARKLVIDLSIMTVIGLVLAIIGPFGTAAAPLALRMVSWVGLAWVGYAFYRPLAPLVAWLHVRLQLPKVGLWIGLTMLATVPLTVAIWIIEFLPGPIPAPTVEDALLAYLNVLVIGACITVVFYLLERSKADGPAQASETPPVAQPARQDDPRPAFLQRLPAELGSDLIALEMEDHYVRAHTALGSHLVLLRLRDALGELDGIDGAQVHRSWWVARDAVESVERDGRSVRLVLPRGIAAPVARSRVAELAGAGWF